MTENSTPPQRQATVLAVRDLRTYYYADDKIIRAVDGVSFEVPRGGSVGLAGESGSGKTQTVLSVQGLVDDVPGIVGGEVWLDGINVLANIDDYAHVENNGGLSVTKAVHRWHTVHEGRMARLRGDTVSMVFQEPKSALVPYLNIGAQLRETMLARGMAADHIETQSMDLLGRLQFADPGRVMKSYPHELSGGESQRVMLGLALVGDPQLLVADEPTTALDAIIQRRVLDILAGLVADMDVALLLITHNLALLSLLVNRIAVMFAGKILEWGPTASILGEAATMGHPYTQDLLRAATRADIGNPTSDRTVIDTRRNYKGCRYFHRCKLKDALSDPVRKRCKQELPPHVEVSEGHRVACWAREQA